MIMNWQLSHVDSRLAISFGSAAQPRQLQGRSQIKHRRLQALILLTRKFELTSISPTVCSPTRYFQDSIWPLEVLIRSVVKLSEAHPEPPISDNGYCNKAIIWSIAQRNVN